MKKLYTTIFLIGILGGSVSAQELDIDNLLEGGVNNANALLGDYLQPAFTGFGYALNSGWYNTGKPHKLLGFDFTFGVNMSQVPSSASYFKFDPSKYDDVALGMPENYSSSDVAADLYDNNKLPTMFGPHLDPDEMPYLIFNASQENPTKVTAPQGTGIDQVLPFVAVPAPYAQLGIGLIKNTELKLRLVPEQSFDGSSMKMFGIGVMHDVKQWIPGIKNLPFDLSGFFAYNSLESVAVINDEDPNNIQSAVFDVSGTTLQGIISKKLAILTVYGGLGFTTSKTDFKMLGTYDQIPDNPDPVSLTSNSGGMKANIGARIKLLILTFHAEYSFQEYNTVSAGVGLSIR